MKKRYLFLTMLLALLSSVGFAADINGTWTGTLHTNEGGAFDVLLTLKGENNTVGGTVRVAGSEEIPVQNGKLEGDNISFSVVRTNQERTLKMNFTGTVRGNEMKLTRQIEGSQRTLNVTLTKKQQ